MQVTTYRFKIVFFWLRPPCPIQKWRIHIWHIDPGIIFDGIMFCSVFDVVKKKYCEGLSHTSQVGEYLYICSVKSGTEYVVCLCYRTPHENHWSRDWSCYSTRWNEENRSERPIGSNIICCAAYFILMYGNTFHNRFRKSDAINLNDNMICWPRINCTYFLWVLSELSK